jgi:hypothetical protein
MGPWSEQQADVIPDVIPDQQQAGWTSGSCDPVETEEEKRARLQREQDIQLAEMRREYPMARLFKIAGGWGGIVETTEWAATGNTLDELNDKLSDYFE